MTWAPRLKRVLKIDIQTCEHCGRAVKVAAPAHPARAAFVHPCTASRCVAVVAFEANDSGAPFRRIGRLGFLDAEAASVSPLRMGKTKRCAHLAIVAWPCAANAGTNAF